VNHGHFKSEMLERLEVFEMWNWRHVMRITWTEQKTNEQVLEAVRTERTRGLTESQTEEVVRTCTAT